MYSFLENWLHPNYQWLLYGKKFTVQEFLLHHDRLGVLFFTVIEKGLFIVQMIKSTINNVCMRGQDNWWMKTPEI